MIISFSEVLRSRRIQNSKFKIPDSRLRILR